MRSRVSFYISALLFLGALFAIGTRVANADVPDSITYQGVLKTAGGVPVADGSYSVTFKIYDVASGGAALWTETKSVTTVDGLFTTFLGSVAPLPSSIFSGPNRFLGIAVSPDPEMSVRTAIVAVPYAYRIATVDGSTGGTISGDVGVSAGNLDLDASSAASGNVIKGGSLFIHDYGTNNTFIGRDAGNLTMTGTNNTASGAGALISNTTGNSNTASGFQALFSNTTGFNNTASGINALVLNTTGNSNTASGVSTLRNNTTGSNNTANGDAALFSNTTGFSNTASGVGALRANTTGSNNTVAGDSALLSNTTGSTNTALGYAADVATGALTNATAIGANAIVAASNSLVLGGTGANAVNVGVRTTTPRSEMDVVGTGAIIVPVGTTAERPATPVQGMIRFNTTVGKFEGYGGAVWSPLN